MDNGFKKLLRTSLVLGLALCFCLGLSTTALAGGKVFKIGSLCDLTGPFSAGTAPFLEGQRAYQRYVNEDLGGINGVKVELVAADCQMKLDKEIAAYKKFRDVDKVLMFFNLNSAGTAAIAPMAKRDGIPHMYLDEPKAVFLKGGWYFGIVPIWGETGAACFDWWLENVWNKKETRKPRVGLLTADYQGGYTIAIYIREFLRQKNIPIVLDMYTPLQTADAMTYVQALRKAKVDIVINGNTASTGVVVYKTIHALGLKMAKLSSIPTPLASSGLRKAMGESGVGILAASPFALWDQTDVPAIKLIHDLYAKWYPGKNKMAELGVMVGWTEMSVACEALRRAMKKVGYEALTKDIKKGRKILKETLENDMRGFDGKGLFAPITYTPTDHKCNARVKITRLAPDTKIEILTGWVSPPPLKPEQRDSKWWDEQLKKK